MPNIKDQYTRKNIRSDMLKLVIFRFDISGVTDFSAFIGKLKSAEFMHKAFYRMKHLSNSRCVPFDKNSFSENGTLPLSENIQSGIYQFYDCHLEQNSDARLDVTANSISLSIRCDGAYEGSGKYTKFMVKIFDTLVPLNSYVYCNRIGIRKIDSVDVADIKSISSYFDNNFVVVKDFLDSNNISESTKTSIFLNDDIRYNIVQHISKRNENRYHVVFDVDAHIDDDDSVNRVISGPAQLYNLLYVDMQDKMFDFFKNVASVKYLEKCKIRG